MTRLAQLERRLAPFAVRRLTLLIVLGQAAAYVLMLLRAAEPDSFQLIPREVLAGQHWRLLSFILMPPLQHPVFLLFSWYLFFLMGSALENQWGALRYNVFLLVGYALTVGVSFATPSQPASTVFLGGSVFLAFAFLYPEFVLHIFFILPVKIRWLALATWVGYAYMVLFGDWRERLLIVASIGNYLLFFGRDIALAARRGGRKMAGQVQELAEREKPRHVCAACGRDDIKHPELEFRYCTDCRPAQCYCTDHLRAHEHRASTES